MKRCWHACYVLWVWVCNFLRRFVAKTYAQLTHTSFTHTNTSYSQTRQLHTHTSTHTHTQSTHTKHTDHTTLSLISFTPGTNFIRVYCARSSTPSTHVSSQYTTLPPMMLPVLSRQVPLQQSAQRHHSCQSGEHGLPVSIVRAIV